MNRRIEPRQQEGSLLALVLTIIAALAVASLLSIDDFETKGPPPPCHTADF